MYMIEISKVYAHRDKTTLKLSHQICMQSRLLSVATPCPLVLPHLLNDAFFCRPRHIHFNNATRLFLA